MTVLNNKQREDLLEAAKPLIKWINDNLPHPHHTVMVDMTDVQLHEMSTRVRCEDYIRD